MIIRSMTATFGKLEHKTLALEPGMNLLRAPNEWGKSTWCAFLTAMLYGIETRAKTTRTALADKERYAPWSGSPMAGRLEITWQGKNITIERSTKGRIPLGEFRAYETDSGLAIPALTADNCGQVLLGVERSVFLRAGMIRLSDLPVTQDDAFRRRLNALVTTGDESGDADKLARGLKELKNRCRYNRTGLLPQAEAERTAIEEMLRERELLEEQQGRLRTRLGQVDIWLGQLKNHDAALRYAAAQADAGRVAQAQTEAAHTAAVLAEAQARCRNLPSREQAQWAMDRLRDLEQTQQDLQMEVQMLPRPEPGPEAPEVFRGMDAQTAREMAGEDARRHAGLKKNKPWLLILGLLLAVGGVVALAMQYWIPGGAAAVLGAAALVWAALDSSQRRKARLALEEKYGSSDPGQWSGDAEAYCGLLEAKEAADRDYAELRGDLDIRLAEHREKIHRGTRGKGLRACMADWQGILDVWDHWANAYREHRKAENLLQTLKSMAKSAQPPVPGDQLTYSEADTARLLSDAAAERQQILTRLSQYEGRLEAMESRESLQGKLVLISGRIARLEDTYAALAIAQQALAEASQELQRRFAPKITCRAEELMQELTGGRYDRLTLAEDLTLRAGAQGEDTLHDAQWRSEGTMDQLYLALRLAVAEVLTPDAPLVLDDALARFDDGRRKAAMEILERIAREKQVIFFTCQGAEN